MKPLFNGDPVNLSKFRTASLLAYGALLALLLVVTGPDLIAKIKAQDQDGTVALAADWEDVVFFSGSTSERTALLNSLRGVPFHIMTVPSDIREQEEATLREQGFGLLWRVDGNSDWRRLAQGFKEGDGILLNADQLMDHPAYPLWPATFIRERRGFSPLLEFTPVAPFHPYYQQIKSRLVRAHGLGTREMAVPKKDVWEARLFRAVNERWIRLLHLRFSSVAEPRWSIDFYKGVTQKLKGLNYNFGGLSLFPQWETNPLLSTKLRRLLILILAVLAPVFSLLLIQRFETASPFLAFGLASALTLFSGVTIHALGSHPDIVLGVASLRGVKLQLLAPLVLAAAVCVSIDEIRSFLEIRIKVKHLIGICGGMAFLTIVYLTRSGNNPIFPVSDGERRLRDVLEAFLGVRPRFKEFMIGHPLFILALYLRSLARTRKILFEFRPFLLLGLLGQISIVNTFTHFHSPLDLSFLRTLHGLWVGALIALPVCHFYPRAAEKISILKNKPS